MLINFAVGPASLALVDPDPGLARSLSRLLDPYSSSPGGSSSPDVCIRRSGTRPHLREIRGDAGDGLTTAVDEAGTLHALVGPADRDWWALRFEPRQASLTLSPSLPAWRVFGPVIRPLLQLALHRHDAVAVHASAARIHGAGVLVSGWSESGKTETILALLEAGARFVSDKWTILAPDGTLGAFPAPVFVRRWVLRYLPGFEATLGAGSRAQLLAGRAAAALSEPMGRLGARGPLFAFAASTFGRAVGVADGIRLTPTQVRQRYGEPLPPVLRAPLDAIVLLTTVPGGRPVAGDLDPRVAARRMARSAAFERRGFYELTWRMGVPGDGAAVPSADRDQDLEARMLEDWLRRVPAIEVRAPFPTDPRRVADLITATLRP